MGLIWDLYGIYSKGVRDIFSDLSLEFLCSFFHNLSLCVNIFVILVPAGFVVNCRYHEILFM